MLPMRRICSWCTLCRYRLNLSLLPRRITRLANAPKAKRIPHCALIAFVILLGTPEEAIAGGLAGVATEWTQLLNNAELARLTSLETSHLSIAGDTLATEVEQLRNLILAYRNMVANTERLPGSFHRRAHDPIIQLRRLYMEAGSLIQSGRELDDFLQSGQISDPLFDQKGYSRNFFAERYDALLSRWTAALEINLGKAGLTNDDVETEARLVDLLAERANSASGNLAALQVANELATSLSRQVLDLRSLQAAQAEQTAVAWSRVLLETDAREALQRDFEEQLAMERSDVSRGESIHELLGIER